MDETHIDDEGAECFWCGVCGTEEYVDDGYGPYIGFGSMVCGDCATTVTRGVL
jgi:hypothetical protein